MDQYAQKATQYQQGQLHGGIANATLDGPKLTIVDDLNSRLNTAVINTSDMLSNLHNFYSRLGLPDDSIEKVSGSAPQPTRTGFHATDAAVINLTENLYRLQNLINSLSRIA